MGKAIEIRAFFSVVGHALQYFNTEAAMHQNIAAHYVRMPASPQKDAIWSMYRNKMVMRLNLFYIQVIGRIIRQLNYFMEDGSANKSNVLTYLEQNAGIWQLLNTQVIGLRTKLGAARKITEQARNIFDASFTGTQELKALPSVATRSLAERTRGMGRMQYSRLAPDDPCRAVAECWDKILEGNDRLLNPAPGSPAADDNQALTDNVANTRQQVDVQRQALESRFPDPPAVARQTPGTGLVNQPAPTACTYSQPAQTLDCVSRVILIAVHADAQPFGVGLARDEHEMFRSVTGFTQTVDPVTGFTRYQRDGNPMSNAEWRQTTDAIRRSKPPAAAVAGPGAEAGQPDLAGIENDLQLRLTYLGDQLRANEALVPNAIAQGAQAAGQTFGDHAAQQSGLLSDVGSASSRLAVIRRLIQAEQQGQGQAPGQAAGFGADVGAGLTPAPSFASRRLEQNYQAFKRMPMRNPPPLDPDASVFSGVQRRLFPGANS